jgi:cell division protein FtsB
VKKLIALLLVIVGALQYRLWFGDGGIQEYHRVLNRIEELKEDGEKRRERNAALDADVRDLKEGTDAIEERARQELGMVREGETFIQVIDKPRPPPRPEAESEPARRPAAKAHRRQPKDGKGKGKAKHN